MGSVGEGPTVTGKVTRAKADWNHHRQPRSMGSNWKGHKHWKYRKQELQPPECESGVGLSEDHTPMTNFLVSVTGSVIGQMTQQLSSGRLQSFQRLRGLCLA